MLGVIAGTGLEHFFKGIEAPIKTDYGSVHAILTKGDKIAFISRHGFAHDVPPHKINHKAHSPRSRNWGERGFGFQRLRSDFQILYRRFGFA